MEFFADWHTHSRYSDGRGTIEENTAAAVGKGLEQLAITDHCPANIGVGVKDADTFFQIQNEIEAVNEKFDSIKVMLGAEADIIGADGSIDIPRRVVDRLDILIVGLHPYIWPCSFNDAWSVVGVNQMAQVSRSYRKKARVNNTKALKEAVLKYDVDFISHPNLRMPVDVAELAAVCVTRDTALEINTGHHYDKEALVRAAEKSGVNFVVNSDAHFPETVGNLASGGALLERFNIPVSRILNAREARH